MFVAVVPWNVPVIVRLPSDVDTVQSLACEFGFDNVEFITTMSLSILLFVPDVGYV